MVNNSFVSLLSNDDVQRFRDLIEASHTIGGNEDLVLHGGGNSSIKAEIRDVTGEMTPTLIMKASGSSMGEADENSFAPLDLNRLQELLSTELSDDEFEKQVRRALLDPDAATPSLETLVHAAIPFRAILHSHADILLAITDTDRDADDLRAIFGPRILVLDYGMPGMDLAKVFFEARDKIQDADGAIIPRHGLFTWADTAEEALRHHQDILTTAESFVRDNAQPEKVETQFVMTNVSAVAKLRRKISDTAGRSMLVRCADPSDSAHALSHGIPEALERGPITPDHVTRIKPWPLVGDDVDGYAAKYARYTDQHKGRRSRKSVEIDAAPRVIVSDTVGLAAAADTPEMLGVNLDMARHNVNVARLAESLGGYKPSSEGHIHDLEYWALQAQKLSATSTPLAGRAAIVTGAASGIGRACAERLIQAGCAVAGWDISPGVTSTFETPAWLGQVVDVTDPEAVASAIEDVVTHFGGIDILVPSAGIFPTSKPLGEMPFEEWRRTMSVNLDSVVHLYSCAAPYLKLSYGGARVAVVASKNVLAPGSGAAAYSSSKAGITQLSRVAALEWASSGVRVNLVHPDAVFDTGLWTEELLAQRAAHYGLSIDDYKRRNLLKAEVTSRDVAEMVFAMVSDTFRCTTGAQVAVDGGSDRTL